MTFSSVMEYTVICSLTTADHCSGRLDDVPAIVSLLESCIIDIYAWWSAKRLHLNADKTELLWFGPASQLRRLLSHNSSINVKQCIVEPVTVVRDLGVWFDAQLSMRSHVSWVAQMCFTICAEYVPFDDSSAATLQQD